MRVTFSYRQLAAVRYWGTERHREYLSRPDVVKRYHHVAMPVAGWKVLASTMTEEVFSRWGVRRRSKMTGEMTGSFAALTVLSRALLTIEAHPALRGEAMMGSVPQVLCVWMNREGWQLTPSRLSTMFVMFPRYQSGVVTSKAATWTDGLTTWTADEPEAHAPRVLRSLPGYFPEEDHQGWERPRVEINPRLAE